MQSWLEGRIWVGKGTSNRDDRKLENTVKQSCESFTRSTEAGVSASRVTTLRRLQEKGYQATSEPETTSEASYLGCAEKNWTVAQWSKVLFSDESKFCISFGNQGPRVWRKSGEAPNPCCLKSSVKFPQSVMIWANVICWCWSTVFSEVHSQRSHLPGILEHFMLPSADKLYGDADFIFQQDMAPAHTAKGTKSWFNDHGVTVLDWPANSPDLNPIENLWCIVKRKMRDTRPNNADELKATVKETWASIPPQQCHKLIIHATPNWGSN